MAQLPVPNILYYVFSSIYFFAFLLLIPPLVFTLVWSKTRKRIVISGGADAQGEENDISSLRRQKFVTLFLICVVQVLASVMNILNISLYLVYAFTVSYWAGHTLVVSSITYLLNLIGQILTFSMLVTFSKLFIVIVYESKAMSKPFLKLVNALLTVLSVIYGIAVTCLIILIPLSAVYQLPTLDQASAEIWRATTNITTAIGWGAVTLLTFCVSFIGFICSLLLLRTVVANAVGSVLRTAGVKVVILTIALQFIAFVQAASTIIGIPASLGQNQLYVGQYIIDKTVALIFVILCLIVFGPFTTMAKAIRRRESKSNPLSNNTTSPATTELTDVSKKHSYASVSTASSATTPADALVTDGGAIHHPSHTDNVAISMPSTPVE